MEINKEQFIFKHLPDFASYILEKKINEFVTIGIRFCKEEKLPLMKSLAEFPEEELVKRSERSSRLILTALAENKIADHIEAHLENWVSNKLGLVDKNEIDMAELTTMYFIRRKQFSYFLYGYTQNVSVQQLIMNEVNVYTSTEERLALKVYMSLHEESY